MYKERWDGECTMYSKLDKEKLAKSLKELEEIVDKIKENKPVDFSFDIYVEDDLERTTLALVREIKGYVLVRTAYKGGDESKKVFTHIRFDELQYSQFILPAIENAIKHIEDGGCYIFNSNNNQFVCIKNDQCIFKHT